MFIFCSLETYSEALRKLTVVECKRYAFTSNSEIEQEQQAQLLEKEVQKKILQKSLSAIKTQIGRETEVSVSAAESSKAKTKGKDLFSWIIIFTYDIHFLMDFFR